MKINEQLMPFNENQWQSPTIHEHKWISIKILQDFKKIVKIYEKINQNHWKFMKMYEINWK